MINKIKGTRDYSPKEKSILEMIRKSFIYTLQNYNYNLIETPIIEMAQLYKRSVAGSDIVKKEMYEFSDKGQREIALRPEGTAGFVRALIENKWYATLKTTKFAYFGPMFRYEQPQKGRQRQFYQAGVELISAEANPYQDAELIIMADSLLKMLGIKTRLLINSIGDQESRENYQNVLKHYFTGFKDQLNDISKERLNNNVLRILDDKEESQKDFVKKAPKINKYLSDKSQKYFTELLSILDDAGVKYQINYSLVRGLDYYDEVVYEFVSQSPNAGSQSTVIGGGRYSNLIKELDGPALKASGWGLGADRLIEIINDELSEENDETDCETVDIVCGCTTEYNKNDLFNICNELRSYGVKVDFIFDTVKSKKLFDRAKKLNASFAIFTDEFSGKNSLIVKNLKNNDKITFNISEDGFVNLLEFLAQNNLEAIVNLSLEEDDEE
ncbi:histidine--tRNA ligase [Mycoplasmopsis felifaucium]|uniref:histidine--tRNA ligase n=1 Tax=Mycoplasmopsis felifaucium TaxID=35768 RepID=UPI000484E391|nr:histidine--tRNA ligase [Mycoplasmopsis felifaucium]